MSPSTRHRFLRSLASALLAGDWSAGGLTAAARAVVPPRAGWVPALARRVLAAFPDKPGFDHLSAFLGADAGIARALRRGLRVPRRVAPRPAAMGSPPAVLGPLPVPPILTEAALAEWLGLTPPRLRWLADVCGRNRKHPAGPLRPYRHRWVAKPDGRRRLLEIPNRALKAAQRKILAGILDHVPPHPAAHGFRPGRSVVTNAEPHTGKRVVIRFDLADFFPTVTAGRVFGLFRSVGYPEAVARLLAGLCTTRLPADVWDARPNPAADGSDHAEWQRLAGRHLPQGAPTSPAVANLAAVRLDRRLAGLAAKLGADYTRYADDLTLSGGDDLRRAAARVRTAVAVIAAEEGFAVNVRKTRVMTRGERQQVAGVVVNVRPNVPRADFDRLKAVLTNCVRHGPAGQNRGGHPDFRAYLAGSVAHVAMVNPARGRKLWAVFDRIAWPPAPPPAQ